MISAEGVVLFLPVKRVKAQLNEFLTLYHTRISTHNTTFTAIIKSGLLTDIKLIPKKKCGYFYTQES